MLRFLKLALLVTFINCGVLLSVEDTDQQIDTLRKAKELLQEAVVKPHEKSIQVSIRNVDISRFPLVKIIIEASNVMGGPLDTLYATSLTVLENDVEKPVISVERINVKERVPVDFLFMIDITGSMQNFINGVKQNISAFTQSLLRRGIDYNLGLILFSDIVDKVYEPTNDVLQFLEWLGKVKAFGGGDEKENALEALARTKDYPFRPSANKVVVLITDAPYHMAGESGDGKTEHTLTSIIKLLNEQEVRVFSIVPKALRDYSTISQKTRGVSYDIDFPFATILDNFSKQLTNLYAVTYLTGQPAIPDSIRIALLNEKKQELVRKIIPIIELGRKLIIENLLYETNSYRLADTVPELEVLYEFMKNKPNVHILVEGHTDAVGSHKVNDALSLLRAESVKNYLVSKGISPSRIQTKGYGKRRPIADNSTAFGRSLNRRTEIVIIQK